MAANNRGADLKALPRQTSIELAPLVSLLARAIADPDNKPDAKNPKNRSLFSYNPDKKRLRICTSGVLLRLFTLLKHEPTFKLESGREFLQNFNPPPYKFRSRLGGKLTERSKDKLPNAIESLKQVIAEELEASLPDEISLSDLVCQDAEGELRTIAGKVKTSLDAVKGEANLASLIFEQDLLDKKKQVKKVAKLISARETIETGNYFQKMCAAIEDYTENQLGWDEDEIEDAIASLEAEENSLDSEVNRFLAFLNDEAMSRVRAQVSRQIMDAIEQAIPENSTGNEKFLKEYIRRINYFIELVSENGFQIDLTAIYGDKADINMLKYINNSSFFWCLAVWPEWNAQIFEEETRNGEVIRDVTYRFRINGQNPERDKPAFEARLEDIETYLIPEDKERAVMSPPTINRCLIALIFLTVVVPSNVKTQLSKDRVWQGMKNLKKRIEENGQSDIKKRINDLCEERSSSMNKIASALIAVIKNKGNKIISRVRKTTSQQYICVKRDILNLDRLRGAEIGSKNLLQKELEWFQQIEVNTSPDVPNLLFSIKVDIELSERNLVVTEEETKLKLQRKLASRYLQILWIPYIYYELENIEKAKTKKAYRQSTLIEEKWFSSSTIEIEYSAQILTKNKTHQDRIKNEELKQIHTLGVTAFPILIYCCLWIIITQIKNFTTEENTSLIASMLRFQQIRETDDRNGEGYVYAAAQAIEAILARELPVRMQGMVLDNLNGKDRNYVRRGTFNALLSAFPFVISTPQKPEVPKIGLISYIARPCDENPHEKHKNHLFLSQSYLANAVEKPFIGYELQTERMQSEIVYSDEDLKRQRLVREEIAYLQKRGCEHIILLSHSYKSRRINKIVEDNTPLITKDFLQELFQTFPNLTLYTLLRDVFPATRLHQRQPKEAAFEILRASDHSNFSKTFTESNQRDIIPIYTFATLHAIAPTKRPQSGFCIYFLVSDRRTENINQTERSRQHLINPEGNSPIHPCLLSVLRGLHFIESEKGIQKQQYLPVLDPFGWISPNTVEAAGEVHIMHSRRKGKVLLSYRAILTHISGVLNIGG